MFNINSTKSLLFSALLITSFTSEIFAQEVEEVVVTATKKEESTQDIAVSIEALTDELLKSEQVYDMTDLAEVVPGFGVAKGVGSGSAYSMRGIGSYGVGAAVVGSIVTSINGHSVNTSVMNDMGFIDLERIEVLKGPQGTLFGRNSVGGVVNLVTKRPTSELEGYVDVEIGSYNRQTVTGAFNVPMSDNVNTRLAFSTNKIDGMVENGFNSPFSLLNNRNTGEMMDDRNDAIGRLSVDWDIDDLTELKFTYFIQESDDNRPQEEVTFCQQDPFFGCSPYAQGSMNVAADTRGTAGGGFGFIAGLYPGTITNSYAAPTYADSFEYLALDRAPTHYQKIEVSNLELVREISDELTMVAKYSYETRIFNQMNDNDGSVSLQAPLIGAGGMYAGGLGLPPIEGELCFGGHIQFCEYVDSERTYDFSDVDTTSRQAEINIISNYDGPFNFTVGLYSFDQRGGNEYRVQTTGSQFIGDFGSHPYAPTVADLLGYDLSGKAGTAFYQELLGLVALVPTIQSIQQGAVQAGLLSPLVAQGVLASYQESLAAILAMPDVTVPVDLRGTLNDQHIRIQSQALYGEMYYDLDDTTKLTLGLRYDDFSTAAKTYNDLLASGYILTQCYLFENRMDCPFMTSYEVVEDEAVNYKLALQKYLSDDVMVYSSYTTATKGGGVNAGANPGLYDEEDSSVIDFGLKAKFLDGAMLLNMNVFRNDNKGMLVATIENQGSFNNNVDAEITGFEGLMNVFLSETTNLQFSWLLQENEITSDTMAINFLNPANATGVAAYLGAVDENGTGMATGAVFDNGVRMFKSIGFNCSIPHAPLEPCLGVTGYETSLKGNTLPGTAETSYSLALTQLFPGEYGTTSMRLAYRYGDSTNSDPFNMERFTVPEVKLFDLLVRYTPNEGDWYVGLYSKNLADDRQLGALRSASNLQGGQLYGSFTDGRTWGLQFGAEF